MLLLSHSPETSQKGFLKEFQERGGGKSVITILLGYITSSKHMRTGNLKVRTGKELCRNS